MNKYADNWDSIFSKQIHLSQKEFDELLDYSCSLPTGTTLGKRWKCRNNYHDASKGWVMGEYMREVGDQTEIRWREIIIK